MPIRTAQVQRYWQRISGPLVVTGLLMLLHYIAARRATLPGIILSKCAVGRLDLLPGSTACANTAAHWVSAKKIIGGGYQAGYTARITAFAVKVKLCCD